MLSKAVRLVVFLPRIHLCQPVIRLSLCVRSNKLRVLNTEQYIKTISSTESSPVSEKPGPPSSSPSKTTQVLDIDDISSDGSEDVNFARSRPKKSKPKRLILSDDESEPEPEPQPTKTKPTL